MNNAQIYILGIESSCDDTSAAVLLNNKVLSNCTASQQIHEEYGGVVPELASRAHQQNIVPVVHQALLKANVTPKMLSGIAYTRGPGLMGSLLVGSAFAKSMAQSLQLPLYDVHHMQAHILAHFIEDANENGSPTFPFLCLTVSGGHTQIVRVDSPDSFICLGETIDDAAGEAFDKAAKLLGLPYPGGPLIDKLAAEGDPHAYRFAKPNIPDLNFSFSGLKTSFLYFIQKAEKKEPGFIEREKVNLAASLQHTIVTILLDKVEKAVAQTGITQVAIAGGVSANSGLRTSIQEKGKANNWQVYIPKFSYCTDNGAMIAMSGYFMHQAKQNAALSSPSMARWGMGRAV